MASRYYFPSSGATDITPAIDGIWDKNTASPSRLRLPLGKSNTAFATTTITEDSNTTNALDWFVRQYISGPLQPQTINSGGTIQCWVRERENLSDAHYIGQLVVKIVSYDGTTVRGTLVSGTTDTTNPGGALWEFRATSTSTAWSENSFPSQSGTGTVIGSDLAIQNGDRIIVEIGYRANNTVSTADTASFDFGDNNATDVGTTEGTKVTGNANSWLEFSQTLLQGWQYSASGLLSLGASADASLTTSGSSFTGSASGVVTLGSNSVVVPTYLYKASSLLSVGGSSVVAPTYLNNSSGLLSGGGSSIVAPTYLNNASGVLSVGGSASVNPSYLTGASGLLSVGGSSNVKPTYLYNASGLASVGGSAAVSFTGNNTSFSYTASGLMSVGASVAASLSFSPSTSGVLSVGGSSNVKPTYLYNASGLLSVGGSSVVKPTYLYNASGLLSVGGSATAQPASASYTYTASGLVSVGGSSVASNSAENKLLIISSDCGDDDDAMAFAYLGYTLNNTSTYNTTILAVLTDKRSQYGGADAGAFLYRYGYRSVPVGKNKTSFTALQGFAGAETTNATAWCPTLYNYIQDQQDAVTLARTKLAAASDNSLIWFNHGWLDNLSNVLASSGDGIDSRNGIDLCAAKLKRCIIMGGTYPSGTESNFSNTPSDANYVVTNFPSTVPLYFVGNEINSGITLAASLFTSMASDSPVRLKIGASVTGVWDATAAIAAYEPNVGSAFYSWTQGVNSVNASTGANTFTSGAGNHYYATKLVSNATFQNHLTGRVNFDVAPPTFDATNPYDQFIFNQSPGALTATSQNGLVATPQGTAAFTGSALSCVRSTGFATSPTNDTYRLFPRRSRTFLIQFTTKTLSGSEEIVFGGDRDGGGWWRLSYNATQWILVTSNGTASENLTITGPSPANNTTYKAVLVFDGSVTNPTVKLFLSGVLLGTLTRTSSSSVVATLNNFDFGIGAGASDNARGANINIAKWQVYDGAAQDSQAQALSSFSATGGGLVSVGGSSNVKQTYLYNASGVLSVGGSTRVQPTYLTSPSGLLSVGGSATAQPAIRPVASGVLRIANAALFAFTLPTLVTGGINIGGSADVRPIYKITTSGVLGVGGGAGLGVSFNYTPAGNLQLSGSAGSSLAFGYLAAGLLVCEGSAGSVFTPTTLIGLALSGRLKLTDLLGGVPTVADAFGGMLTAQDTLTGAASVADALDGTSTAEDALGAVVDLA